MASAKLKAGQVRIRSHVRNLRDNPAGNKVPKIPRKKRRKGKKGPFGRPARSGGRSMSGGRASNVTHHVSKNGQPYSKNKATGATRNISKAHGIRLGLKGIKPKRK